MTSGIDPDTIGPVDVATILFEGNQFNGDVAPALAQLHESGTARILDLAFVRRDLDGAASIVEVDDADVGEAFERATGEQFALLNDHDLEDIAVSLEPGLVGAGDRLGEHLAGPVRHGRPRVTGPGPGPGTHPPRERAASHRRAGRGVDMPRRMGRPGLMGTMARTAVIAGTATAVSGSVRNKQATKAAQQQQAAAAQQQAAAPQPQAPVPPAAPAADDRMARIKELGEMKAAGLLTEEEFSAEKAKILAS